LRNEIGSKIRIPFGISLLSSKRGVGPLDGAPSKIK
jgi:hypothetical protein